jgi:DNA-binding transcriptional MerR regulator
MSAAAILKLQASGFSVEQVSALAELVDTQAATKADVEAASHKLDQKIDAVEHRLELKVGELKSDLEATEHRLDQKIDGVEHRLELKIEGLDRKITETNANTLKWVISAIGFQTLVLVGTIVGAVAALTRFIPAAPIIH